MRRPLKIESFRKINELNVPIKTVIDVGILTGTGELMAAFKDQKHLLIEPIVEWNETIREKYGKAGINFELVNVAASNENGIMNMETSTVIPGHPISHARLTEKTSGAQIRSVPVRTIDSLLSERDLAKPFLLKIDVDGVELLILEGAKNTLEDCSVVVIEAGIWNLLERAGFLSKAGFQLFDIVDPCYYSGRLVQVDLIFLNQKTIRDNGLEVYKHGFDFAKWEAFV